MRREFKPNVSKFNEIDFKKKVEKELKNSRELYGLFLIHGYIEAYLIEWLFTTGHIRRDEFSTEVIKAIEKLSFNNLIHIHLVLGNIDYPLFENIKNLNEARNAFAHEIIKIDIYDEKTRNKISKIVLNAIKTCDKVFKLYKKALDELQEEIKL